MNQAKRIRLADEESSVEDSDTTMKPQWDSLPYPVIHTIAKVDLQIVLYRLYNIAYINNNVAHCEKSFLGSKYGKSGQALGQLPFSAV